jgi:hypothetical protein
MNRVAMMVSTFITSVLRRFTRAQVQLHHLVHDLALGFHLLDQLQGVVQHIPQVGPGGGLDPCRVSCCRAWFRAAPQRQRQVRPAQLVQSAAHAVGILHHPAVHLLVHPLLQVFQLLAQVLHPLETAVHDHIQHGRGQQVRSALAQPACGPLAGAPARGPAGRTGRSRTVSTQSGPTSRLTCSSPRRLPSRRMLFSWNNSMSGMDLELGRWRVFSTSSSTRASMSNRRPRASSQDCLVQAVQDEPMVAASLGQVLQLFRTSQAGVGSTGPTGMATRFTR